MKPFLTCLLVLSALVMLAGCGGSSAPPIPPPNPNPVGFTAANLNGNYVFRLKGSNYGTGSIFSAIGFFAADGAGNITSGQQDTNDSIAGASTVNITGGTYTVGVDGRGHVTFTYATAPTTGATFDFVLNSTSVPSAGGQMIGFTAGDIATGVLEQQQTYGSGSIDSTYVLLWSGYVPGGGGELLLTTRVGALTLSGNAHTATAIFDENLNGTFTSPAATVTVTTPPTLATHGRGTLQLVPGLNGAGSTSNVVFYAVGPNRLEFIVTDTSSRVVGWGDRQTTPVTPAGNFAFVIYGSTLPWASGFSFAEVGSFHLDQTVPATAITSGLEDVAEGGYSFPLIAFTGSVDPAFNPAIGRQLGEFQSAGRTVTFVLWYSDSQHAVMMTKDAGLLESGMVQQRQLAIPANATVTGNYALNLWGVSGCCLLAWDGQVHADGAGTFVGLEDYNYGGGLVTGVAASGSYSIDATTGRGTGTFGRTPVVLYPLDGNTVFVMTSEGSVVTGSLLLQH
ncbi:MAG: hypothetical protein ABSD88_08990 [Candidatus Korobacteraceae bacterium]